MIMDKREAELQGRFTPYLKNPEGLRNVIDKVGSSSIAFEVKVSSCATLAFSRVPEHQIVSLLRAKGSTLWGELGPLVHKLSDSAAGYLPCDCVLIVNGGGCFVMGFFVGTVLERVFLVDVEKVAELIYARSQVFGLRRRKGSVSLEWCATEGFEIFL